MQATLVPANAPSPNFADATQLVLLAGSEFTERKRKYI